MPTPDQIRAARALLNLTQGQVSKLAGLSTMTIKRAEGAGQPPASSAAIAAIVAALEAAGVVFTDADGNGPGVALQKEGQYDSK